MLCNTKMKDAMLIHTLIIAIVIMCNTSIVHFSIIFSNTAFVHIQMESHFAPM